MEDVNISIYRASVVREGSTPASPGFVVSDGQNPVDPSGSGQNHLPVTIATAATGLSITESQVLGGAGNVGQYIRGDGSLADFPESSGGGSSVSYYLNGSVNQGTIGGVAYKELNKVPILGAGTDFTINADGYIASFITDAGDPNLLEIPGGNWNFETYFSASSSGGTPTFYVELYKVNSGGTATLIASNSTFPELIAFGTNIISYFSTLAVPTTALALTDRLAIRYYVTHSGRTITLHTEDNHLCQIITTFTTGLTALNGLTAQVQNFSVGTSGTDFAIASATATHTFNLPTASATNRGALSSADWSMFNGKTSNLGTVTSVGLSSATSGVTIGSSPVTTSGTITLAIATASGSQNGLLSSSDWTTFNSKQNALTNPVTGTGTINYLAKFTALSTIGTSSVYDTGSVVGIGNTGNASYKLLVTGNNASIDSSGNNTIYLSAGTTESFLATSFIAGGPYVPLSFEVGGSKKMTLFTDGNLLLQSGGTFTNNGAKLQVSGTATFSNNVTITASTGNSPLRFTSTSASSKIGYLYADASIIGITDTLNAGVALDGIFFNSTTRETLLFNNGSISLSLALSGAATFSSSVTAGGTQYLVNTSTGTNQVYQRILNTGGDVIIGINANTGAALATGGLAYATAIYNNTNTALQFGTNAAFNMTIAAGGNVGIGTNSPGQRLHVIDTQTSNTSILQLRLEGNGGNFYDIGRRYDNGAFVIQGNQTGFNNICLAPSGGNVGIGTATPTFYGSSYTTLQLNASSFPVFNMSSGGTTQFLIVSSTSETILGTFTNTPLVFYTNSTPKATITSGGNVGIGTASPDQILTIASSSSPRIKVEATTNSQNAGIFLQAKNSGGTSVAGGMYYIPDSTPYLGFFANNNNLHMAITSGGNVLIGTTTDTGYKTRIIGGENILNLSSSTTNARINIGHSSNGVLIGVANSGATGNLFYVTTGAGIIGTGIIMDNNANFSISTLGTGTVYSNGGTLTNTNPSDFNLKENIAPINYGLGEILQLNAVTFNWKNDTINQGKQYGFIAQEVEKIMPDLVKKGEYLGLDKEAIFTTLVKAIQELKQEIDTLKN